MTFYNIYDLKNALENANDYIVEAIEHADALEELEEEVEELEEKVEALEEKVDFYKEEAEELKEEILIHRDASNLKDILAWWVNILNQDDKYKLWSLAYKLVTEAVDNNLVISNDTNE